MFKCRDLLELSSDGKPKEESADLPSFSNNTSLSQRFSLQTATKEVIQIMNLLCKQQRVRLNVEYNNASLQKSQIIGEAFNY